MRFDVGMGMYIRRIQRPSRIIDRFTRYNIDTAVIIGPWSQGTKKSPSRPNHRVVNDVEAFRKVADELKRRGVQIVTMGYPHVFGIEKFVENWKRCVDLDLVDAIMLDMEVEWNVGRYKKISENDIESSSKKLFSLVHDWAKKKPIGVTSYGRPKFHNTVKWSALLHPSVSFVSPQIYSISLDLYDECINEWVSLCREHIGKRVPVAPSFPTFNVNNNELHKKLHMYTLPGLRVDGLIGWSYESTSTSEWKVIRREKDKLFRNKEQVGCGCCDKCRCNK